MRLLTSFQGQITRNDWWTGLLALIAIWFSWRIGSGFLFTGANGSMVSSALAMILFVPLAALCTKRLRDLNRPVMPTVALMLLPACLYSLLNAFTTFGRQETAVPAGWFEGDTMMLAPTAPLWLLLATVLASLVWMVAVLGMKLGPIDDIAPEAEAA